MNKYARTIQAELDLHMMTKAQARREIFEFLEESEQLGYARVRIITGKGLHSSGGVGVLGAYVRELLKEAGYEYQSAKLGEGGSGALIIDL